MYFTSTSSSALLFIWPGYHSFTLNFFNASLLIHSLTIMLWWLQHCYVPLWHVRKKPVIQEVRLKLTWTTTHILYMNYHPHRLCTVPLMVYLLTHCCLCCRAYVFFSSPIQKDLVSQIKKDLSVLPRIGALSEVTLIFLFISVLYLSILKMKRCYVGYSLFVLLGISRWIWSTFLLIPRYQ